MGQRTPGTRLHGRKPGTNWEIYYTEAKLDLYRYKYLLVFVDTFSGWEKAFPTKKEMANIVAKKLLEIISRYGLPTLLGSDNGPAFISQVTQSLVKTVGTD